MKRAFSVVSLLSLAACTAMYAQKADLSRVTPPATAVVNIENHRTGGGAVITPLASIQQVGDIGVRAHTNFKIFVPPGRPAEPAGFPVEIGSPKNTPISGYYAETPASLACVYGETTWTAGCSPATLTTVAAGGAKAIAIVDAYDYPTALADLTAYSKQFGLPAPTASTFTVTWATTKPGPDPYAAGENGWNAWEAEEALDIEMAHAMAPSAHIYLVEALSNSYADLLAAETKAATLVAAAGGGEVSNSWGGGEFSTETSYNTTFTGTNVVFFASTGDSAGTEFPSVSPNVVGVGGTTLSRSPATLALEAEISWDSDGGGISTYNTRPAFQNAISGIVGAHRGVPDISAIGNPYTGVWVYDNYETLYNGSPAPWNIFGGTSVASPLVAAIVNHAGHFAASTAVEEGWIYGYGLPALSPYYRDITYGSCGYYRGWFAVPGWDPCTGVGAPYGPNGK